MNKRLAMKLVAACALATVAAAPALAQTKLKWAHVYETPASWDAAIVEHAAVLEAIRGRDADAARQAMQQHLKKATARYSASWKRAMNP